jgi:hypothetical protein
MRTDGPTIGRDLGPFGRLARLVIGVIAVGAGVANLVGTNWVGGSTVLATAGYVALVAGFYLALHRVLGEAVLARADPFVATVLVLAPVGVLTLSVFPDALHAAIGLYVGASLILNAAIRYGGCEVLALPTLLFRRRYVIYCPANVVDLAERPMHGPAGAAVRAAGVVAVAVGGYILVVSEVLDGLGVADPVSSWWAMVLLVPAGLLGQRAWSLVRARERERATGLGLGAAALALLAVELANVVADAIAITFAVVVLGGAALAAVRLVAGRVRRRRVAYSGGSTIRGDRDGARPESVPSTSSASSTTESTTKAPPA